MNKTIILFYAMLTMFVIVFTIVYTIKSYKKEHFEPVDVKAGYDSGVKVPKISTETIESVKSIKLMNFDILDIIYPVGCIYSSYVNKNPKDLYGFGTWVQLNDVFLLAGKNTSTGGSKKIEVSNLPKHTHKATCANGGDHNHKFTGNEMTGSFSLRGIECLESGGYSKGVFSVSKRNDGISGHIEHSPSAVINFNGTPSGSISNNGTHSHTITVDNTGSGADYMPPYQTVYMWRRSG